MARSNRTRTQVEDRYSYSYSFHERITLNNRVRVPQILSTSTIVKIKLSKLDALRKDSGTLPGWARKN